MLLGEKQSEIKQVAVVTRDQQFNRLLSSVLAEWKFIAVEDLTCLLYTSDAADDTQFV